MRSSKVRPAWPSSPRSIRPRLSSACSARSEVSTELLAIRTAGQATADKVAGPIGESLIMTALGLAVASHAVLGHNVLVRRNNGVPQELNRFAHDLHAYFVTAARVGNGSPAKVVPMKSLSPAGPD